MSANRTLAVVINEMSANNKTDLKQLTKFENSPLFGPGACDAKGRTPLMCAIIHTNIPVLQWILNSKQDKGWDERDNEGMTAFMHAVNYSDQSEMKQSAQYQETLVLVMERITKWSLKNRVEEFSRAAEIIAKTGNMECYKKIDGALKDDWADYKFHYSSGRVSLEQYQILLELYEKLYSLANKFNCKSMAFNIFENYGFYLHGGKDFLQQNSSNPSVIELIKKNFPTRHPKPLKFALEIYKQSNTPELMEKHVVELLDQKYPLNKEHLQIASECQNKFLLKLLLEKAKNSHVNTLYLSDELTAAVWQFPDLACQFINVAVEEKPTPSPSSIILNVILQNYLQIKKMILSFACAPHRQ